MNGAIELQDILVPDVGTEGRRSEMNVTSEIERADTPDFASTNPTMPTTEDKNISSNMMQTDSKSSSDKYQHTGNRGTILMAVYMGTLASLGGFLYGFDTGMINNLISMKFVVHKFSGSTNGQFSTKDTALVTSILSVGTFFGSLLAPIISDRYGRRFSILWATLIFFNLGTILQMVAHNMKMLCAGRFFNGFAVGVISATIPLYQAEISPKWIRGSIISCYQWAITWGLFVSSAISQGTKDFNDARCYQIPIGLQFVWGSFFLLFMWTLPESPRFYVMHDDMDSAILSLSKVRKLDVRDRDLIEEMIEIKASHSYEKSLGPSTTWEFLKGLRSKDQYKRVITGVLLHCFQQCSGINFIFYYGVDFFARTGVEKSYLMSFVTYAVNVVFTVPGILLVETLGRRRLLIFGGIGMFLSNFIIGIVGLKIDSVYADKVMLAFVCVFIAFFAATWGPAPWVISGEIFPLGIRQKGVSICASTNWFINFIFAYITPYLIDTGSKAVELGTSIFFLWGSFNFLGALCTYLLVYESQGLMLEDVDELYRRCSLPWKSLKVRDLILEEHEVHKQKELEAIDAVNKRENIISNTEFTTNDVDDYLAMIAQEQARELARESESTEMINDNFLFRQSSIPPSHPESMRSFSQFHCSGLYD